MMARKIICVQPLYNIQNEAGIELALADCILLPFNEKGREYLDKAMDEGKSFWKKPIGGKSLKEYVYRSLSDERFGGNFLLCEIDLPDININDLDEQTRKNLEEVQEDLPNIAPHLDFNKLLSREIRKKQNDMLTQSHRHEVDKALIALRFLEGPFSIEAQKISKVRFSTDIPDNFRIRFGGNFSSIEIGQDSFKGLYKLSDWDKYNFESYSIDALNQHYKQQKDNPSSRIIWTALENYDMATRSPNKWDKIVRYIVSIEQSIKSNKREENKLKAKKGNNYAQKISAYMKDFIEENKDDWLVQTSHLIKNDIYVGETNDMPYMSAIPARSNVIHPLSYKSTKNIDKINQIKPHDYSNVFNDTTKTKARSVEEIDKEIQRLCEIVRKNYEFRGDNLHKGYLKPESKSISSQDVQDLRTIAFNMIRLLAKENIAEKNVE